jgi:hypothetical protein
VLTVTLVGPDKVPSIVKIGDDTTVRDGSTSNYHLFRRTAKRNGLSVVPFTTRVEAAISDRRKQVIPRLV